MVKEQLRLNEWLRIIYWVTFFFFRTEMGTVKLIFEALESIRILN